MDTSMGCGRAVHVGCDTRWGDGHTCVYVGGNKCIEVNLHTRVSNTGIAMLVCTCNQEHVSLAQLNRRYLMIC